MTVPVILSTYLAISLNMPLADRQLIAMDEAIGFDWFGFIGFVDARPGLAAAFAYAYSSFFFQLLLLPVYLGLSRNQTRAYAMIFAYILICMLASLISIWYPAHGTYKVYGVTPDKMASINAHFGYFFLEQFNAVRDQSEFLLDFGEAAGILTFPSVHAAVAALCAWAAWSSPILRYPVLFLNIAMCLSAVSHANHYMIDVVAGVGLTAFCVAVTQALFFKLREDNHSPVLEVAGNLAAMVAGKRGATAVTRLRVRLIRPPSFSNVELAG